MAKPGLCEIFFVRPEKLLNNGLCCLSAFSGRTRTPTPARSYSSTHKPAPPSLRVRTASFRSRKLAGRPNSWRIRVGDYRILYEIDDANQRVTVFRLAHRRDAYRFLAQRTAGLGSVEIGFDDFGVNLEDMAVGWIDDHPQIMDVGRTEGFDACEARQALACGCLAQRLIDAEIVGVAVG